MIEEHILLNIFLNILTCEVVLSMHFEIREFESLL